MKIAVLSNTDRFDRFCSPADIPGNTELIRIGSEYTDAEVIEKAGDADAIIVDAVLPVSEDLIAGMPKLKLIHSEGVGYARIAVEAASARGIYVCNNRAVNAGQVAEHSVLLILSVLRRFADGR